MLPFLRFVLAAAVHLNGRGPFFFAEAAFDLSPFGITVALFLSLAPPSFNGLFGPSMAISPVRPAAVLPSGL